MCAKLKRGLILILTAALFLEIDPTAIILGGPHSSEAEARIGRPATPGSVAGVARRTTRRTVRRTAHYYAALPGNCAYVTLYGAAVYDCGGTYYQQYGNQYVVVVFD
jgi:hypothetical protein